MEGDGGIMCVLELDTAAGLSLEEEAEDGGVSFVAKVW